MFFFFPQEREFLKNYVQRIVDVRPTLVLVEKTVSRIAQDMLLEHGITLVINVKSVSVIIFSFLYNILKISVFKIYMHAWLIFRDLNLFAIPYLKVGQ